MNKKEIQSILNILGLVLNFFGAILITYSIGEMSGGGYTVYYRSGAHVPFVYFLHPNLFEWGINLTILGFVIQILSISMKSNLVSYWLPRILSALVLLFILLWFIGAFIFNFSSWFILFFLVVLLSIIFFVSWKSDIWGSAAFFLFGGLLGWLVNGFSEVSWSFAVGVGPLLLISLLHLTRALTTRSLDIEKIKKIFRRG